MRPFVLGLTGGIASGKSFAADIMREYGAYSIDADVVSRAVTAPGTDGARAIAAAFPTVAADDGVDRRRLKEIVFSDPAALARLNAITHPRIRAELVRRIEACECPSVVLVVPLLFETGMDDLCDKIVTIACAEPERIKRMIRRDTVSEELARAVLESQLTDAARAKKADFVLYNDGDMTSFRREVPSFCEKILPRA